MLESLLASSQTIKVTSIRILYYHIYKQNWKFNKTLNMLLLTPVHIHIPEVLF